MVAEPITRPVISPIIGGLDSGRPSWSIARLFANGEQGAWYDPSDLSTLFQDSAGTTPVTAHGQPVGLMLDKSGRGNHAIQATPASRPLFQDVGGLRYLKFDGVDDFLSTASINFTGTDKVSLFAGVRKLSDAATGSLIETSTAFSGFPGSFQVRAPGGDISQSYYLGSNNSGSIVAGIASGYLAPRSDVITGRLVAGGTSSIRVSGLAAVTFSTSAGNYGNYPIYIGRRGGTSLPFNGNLYGLIIRGALTDDANTGKVEKLLAGKTGVTLA